MQALNLAFVPNRAVRIAAFKGTRRLIQELLLPSVNLVGMFLITLRQVGHSRIIPQRLLSTICLKLCFYYLYLLISHLSFRLYSSNTSHTIITTITISNTTLH